MPGCQSVETRLFPMSRVMPMKIRVILEPSEEGGFTAIVRGLPGCLSEGETR